MLSYSICTFHPVAHAGPGDVPALPDARFVHPCHLQPHLVGDLPDPMAGFGQLLTILEAHPSYNRLLARDFFSIAAVQCHYSATRVSCGIGRRVIFIDADGSLYPCPNHVAEIFRVGHIATDTLEDFLVGSPVMQAIRERYHIDQYPGCAACPFKRWCAGDCRGEVLATTADPAAKSPHCDSLKRMYTRLLWLLAKGDPRVTGLATGPHPKNAQNTFWV